VNVQKKDSHIPRNNVYYTRAFKKETGERKILGIVFTGGEGPKPQALRHLLAGIDAGALMVAADSGLRLAETAGVMPHWIVGDMDSVDGEHYLERYPGERVIRYTADKDHSDTELALSLLWDNNCTEAWIIGGGGGRIDHLFGIRDLFERERFPCRWITAAEDIRCIDKGGSLVRAIEPGSLVSVFLLGVGPWKAQSQGLKWPLDNVRWERGVYGLSNTAASEEISISAWQGRFLLVFPGINR
jgi:thiamine pyrophosphokinase